MGEPHLTRMKNHLFMGALCPNLELEVVGPRKILAVATLSPARKKKRRHCMGGQGDEEE